MERIGKSLDRDLLDLLVEGPSSFAALYGALIRVCDYPRGLEVFQVMETLGSMEDRGWVQARQMFGDGSFGEATEEDRVRDEIAYQAWLPRAEFEELSTDEVGLWYLITPEGRAEWKTWAGNDDRPTEEWALDDLREYRLLVVRARSLGVAEEVLRRWLSVHPEIELVARTRRVERIPAFRSRSSAVVNEGVEVVNEYRITGSRQSHQN